MLAIGAWFVTVCEQYEKHDLSNEDLEYYFNAEERALVSDIYNRISMAVNEASGATMLELPRDEKQLN